MPEATKDEPVLIMAPDVTVELRLGQLFAECAASVYGISPVPVPRVIDNSVSWTVGEYNIIVNGRTNQLYIAGDLWDVTFESETHRLQFGGKIDGNLHSGKMLISQKELLTLIVIALRITRHEREGPEFYRA
jgi:hypothetical protein